MSTQAIVQERSQLHNWIEGLPSTQFDLVYNFVGELVRVQHDEDIAVESVFKKAGKYPVFTPLNQELAASQLQQFIDQQPSS